MPARSSRAVKRRPIGSLTGPRLRALRETLLRRTLEAEAPHAAPELLRQHRNASDAYFARLIEKELEEESRFTQNDLDAARHHLVSSRIPVTQAGLFAGALALNEIRTSHDGAPQLKALLLKHKSPDKALAAAQLERRLGVAQNRARMLGTKPPIIPKRWRSDPRMAVPYLHALEHGAPAKWLRRLPPDVAADALILSRRIGIENVHPIIDKSLGAGKKARPAKQ